MKFWVWIVIAATILTLGIIVITGFWQHLFNQPHNDTLPQWGVVHI